MKKINITILSLAALLAAISCRKDVADEAPAPSDGQEKVVAWTLNAGFCADEDAEASDVSKTTLNGKKTTWKTGDQIVVNGVASYELEEEDIASGGEYARFSFPEEPSGESLVALYPASAYAGTTEKDGETYYTLNVPSSQSYDYTSEGCDCNSAILVGEGSGDSVEFGHAMAYLKISCDKDVKSIRVMANSHYNSSGNIVAGLAMSGLRRISTEASFPTDYLASDNGSTVALDFGDSPVPAGTAVVMPVIPRNYSAGVNFFVVTPDNKYQIRRARTFNISSKAGKILNISLTLDELKDYSGPGIYSEDDYCSFIYSYADGDYSQWQDGAGVFNLYSDLSSDAGIASISSFSHTFNGNDHTVTRDSSSVALFLTLNEGACIKNLRLAGTGYYSGNVGWGTAQLAVRNYGEIVDCTSAMEIRHKESEGSSNQLIVSSMVCTNSGTMRRCRNTGPVNVDLKCAASRIFMVGGLAGLNTYASDTELRCGNFYDCVNEGDISITKVSADGTSKTALQRCGVGGICARIEQGIYEGIYSVFDGCENEGNISFREDALSSNIPLCFGGLIGSCVPYITSGSSRFALDFSQKDGYYVVIRTNCINRGTLDVSSSCTSATSSSISGARQVYIGGIIGFIFGRTQDLSTTKPYAVLRGYNYGDIKLGSVVGNECAGGLAGGMAFTVVDEAGADFSFGKADGDNLFTPLKAGNCAALTGLVVKRSVILGRKSESNPIKFKMDASGLSSLTVLASGLCGLTSAKSVDYSGTSNCQAMIFDGERYTLFQGRKPDGNDFTLGTYTDTSDGCDALFGGRASDRVIKGGATITVESYPQSE